MRPIPLMTALAFGLLLAGAGAARPAPAAPPAPPASDPATDLPPIAEDHARADAMAAQLAAIDARIGQDEARMTVLRDAELARENARIRPIKPALPLQGITFVQLFP